MAAATTNDDDDRSMTGILCIGARTETVSYVVTTTTITVAHLDVAVNRKFNSGCATQNLDYEAAAQK